MVYLRPATGEDIDLLFQWANEPVVRANSFHTEQIPYEVHRAWFERIMRNENVCQYVLMDGETAVGQIRMEKHMEKAEIGYSVSSEYRGKGYGRMMLENLLEIVKTDYPDIQYLSARVKPNNTPSKKMLESEGYRLNYLYYEMPVDHATEE